MSSLIQKYNAHKIKQRLFSKGESVGYHLCVNGCNYWIGKDAIEAESNLEKALKFYANNGDDFNWYIEHLDGFDSEGNQLWSNLDHTNSII